MDWKVSEVVLVAIICWVFASSAIQRRIHAFPLFLEVLSVRASSFPKRPLAEGQREECGRKRKVNESVFSKRWPLHAGNNHC